MATRKGTTSKASKSSAGTITFDQIAPLFGKPVDDVDVEALLAKSGKVSRGKPDGRDHYVVCKEAGYDLLFIRPDDAKRGAPRVLDTVFLYAEGRDKHRAFASLPFGLAFGPRASILAAMGKPKQTWVIGEGAVKVTHKEASHDTWAIDGFDVCVVYGSDEDGGERVARHVQIERLDPENQK